MFQNNPSPYGTRAFTLVEMLLVVAIISILIGLLMPALGKARDTSRITVCASNQHQVYNAAAEYSAAHQRRLRLVDAGADVRERRFPYDTHTPNGPWMWDMTRDTATQLIASAGGKVDIFFCPSNSDQNDNTHWNYSGNYRVLGYFNLFKRASGPMVNFTLAGGKQFVRSFGKQYDHATQELFTDANLSVGGNFSQIWGGSPIPHRSSHLNRTTGLPTGGNILFLDGHVAWRSFEQMSLRYWGPDHWF